MKTPHFAYLSPNIDPDSPFLVSTPTLPILNRPHKSRRDRPSSRGVLCNPSSLENDVGLEENDLMNQRNKRHKTIYTDEDSFISPNLNEMTTVSALLLMKSPPKKRIFEATKLDNEQKIDGEAFIPLNLNNNNGKPSGRKSPLIKQLSCEPEPEDLTIPFSNPMNQLLLDFEGLFELKELQDTMIELNSTPADRIISPECKQFRDYAAETKYANEYIVTNMERVFNVLNDTSEHQQITPPDIANVGHNEKSVVYTVSVPDSFMALPSEIPSQSFCNLSIEKICNPEDGNIYTRLVHTVGIDICNKTGAIHKNPNDPIPRSIQIVKRSEDRVKLREEFNKAYEQQLRPVQVSSNSSQIDY